MTDEPRDRRILVFMRAPVLGAVKSRLARTIGDTAALAVHIELCEIALRAAAGAADAADTADAMRPEIWVAGDPNLPLIEQWSRRYACSVHRQPFEADLGRRMAVAMADALARGAKRVVLIGSDSPQYSADYLLQGLQALAERDAVFGPAEDGGYVLVGARRRIDAVFDAIDWGTDRVMAQTRQRLVANGIDAVELASRYDVDTHADLLRWRATG